MRDKLKNDCRNSAAKALEINRYQDRRGIIRSVLCGQQSATVESGVGQ
jgi:hypothetical protein